MDILNQDFQLKNDSVARRSSGGKRQLDSTSSDAAFHFIAFVPVIGRVWKFDGLERQPQALGQLYSLPRVCLLSWKEAVLTCHLQGHYSAENWLDLVKPELLARMTECAEDQIEFSILSLVGDPIIDFVKELAVNVKCLQTIDTRFQEEEYIRADKAETIELANGANDYLLGPDLAFELTQQDIDQAEIPLIKVEEYHNTSSEHLRSLRSELAASQRAIKKSIQDELQSRRADEDHAAGRRHDYNPAISYWARSLAKKGLIQDLVIEFTT
jgi:ubiquitin carboxyl-terminal hydrolase L5